MPYVYKYILNDEILYIGKSYLENFSRLRTHGNGNKHDNIPTDAHYEIDKADIYIATYDSEYVVDIIESLLINKYKPKYNLRTTNKYDGLEFGEIKWIPLKQLQDTFLRVPTLNDLLHRIEMLETDNKFYRKQIEEYHSENETLKQTVKILTEYQSKGELK